MRHTQALTMAARGPAVAQLLVDFSGTWTNDLEQTVMTNNSSRQALNGKYTSPNDKGGPITGLLVGWADGNVISFTVDWPVHAITTWVGHLVTENGIDTIETLWHLAEPMSSPEDPRALWTVMLAGRDNFVRS